jgi:general secretion pathway protein L
VTLTLFIPAHATLLGSDTPCEWILADAAGDVLRSGTDPISAIPRAVRTCVVVPSSRVLFTELALPPVSAAKLAKLLPYAVEDKLMSDPAAIHAVAAPPHATRARESVVAVVDKSWLRGVLDALAAQHIHPNAVIPASELIRHDNGIWVVTLGAREGFLTRDDGFAVAFDFGGSGTEAPLALQLALKECAQRSSSPQLVRVVSGDGALDISSWAGQLGVAVELVVPPSARERVSRLFDKNARHIDFLSGAFARAGGWSAYTRLLRPALIVAVVMLALQFGFAALDGVHLERERRAIEASMIAAFKTAFPDARAIVDPALQMQRNLDALKRERGIAGASDFQVQLARAATLVESAGGVKATGVQWSGQRLSVDLEAATAESFEALKARLGASAAQLGPIEKRADAMRARLVLEVGK